MTAQRAWIVSPLADGLFILAAPALVGVAVLVAASIWPPETMWLAVMTFGSVGHHLPGFIRTYGDADLFARHRLRFLVAPPLVFACSWWLASHSLHTMALVTMVWSVWHGMMQHYGFLRIYDAKAGNTSPRDARLDWAVTVCWFGLALTLSPHQGGSLLDALFATGFWLVPPGLVVGLSYLAIAATVVVTTLYLANIVKRRREGKAIAPHKLILLVSTTTLVWLARVVTNNAFVSAALFEVLHDVQYLAIVWGFNRQLVKRGHPGGALQRAMFGEHRFALFGYVALCAAYGFMAYIHTGASAESSLHAPFAALLVTSGILHFYYDGFIWKMRRRETQRGLGLIDPAKAKAKSKRRRKANKNKPAPATVTSSHSSSKRDLVHLAAFLGPVALLAWLEQARPPSDELAIRRHMVDLVPDSATARENLGNALLQSGDYQNAAQHLERAIAISADGVGPTHKTKTSLAQAHAQYGKQLLVRGDAQAGAKSLKRALELQPTLAIAHYNLAVLSMQERDYPAAERYFRRASLLDPRFIEALNGLGGVLAITNRREEAIAVFRRVLALEPQHDKARANLHRLGAKP